MPRQAGSCSSCQPLDALMWKPLQESSRFAWWIVRRVWLPFMAIGWPLLAFHGAVAPRSSDVLALRLDSTEISVLVGVGGGSRTCIGDGSCVVTEPPQRSYVVIPRVLVNGAVTIVEDTSQGSVARETVGLAPTLLLIWVMCIYGTWYFCIRTGI